MLAVIGALGGDIGEIDAWLKREVSEAGPRRLGRLEVGCRVDNWHTLLPGEAEHTFTEHVTIDRGLRRGDAETLGENAAEIGAAAPVPEKTSVGIQFRIVASFKAVVFAMTLDAEYVLNLRGCQSRSLLHVPRTNLKLNAMCSAVRFQKVVF